MFQKRPEELRNGYKHEKTLKAIRKMSCKACEPGEQYYPTEAHHRIGEGIGRKASDLLTFPLCAFHHALDKSPGAIHLIPLKDWEKTFKEQDELILEVHELLGIDIYREHLLKTVN